MLIVAFFANASLLAISCDFFRVNMWTSATGESQLDQAPKLDPIQILERYVKSGAHLLGFMVVTQAVSVWWGTSRVLHGEGFAEVITDPLLWLAAFLPSFYWPIGLALTVQPIITTPNFLAIRLRHTRPLIANADPDTGRSIEQADFNMLT